MNLLAITSSYPRYEGDPTAPFVESIIRHVAARGHTVHVLLPRLAAGAGRPPRGASTTTTATPGPVVDSLGVLRVARRRSEDQAAAVRACAARRSLRPGLHSSGAASSISFTRTGSSRTGRRHRREPTRPAAGRDAARLRHRGLRAFPLHRPSDAVDSARAAAVTAPSGDLLGARRTRRSTSAGAHPVRGGHVAFEADPERSSACVSVWASGPTTWSSPASGGSSRSGVRVPRRGAREGARP